MSRSAVVTLALAVMILWFFKDLISQLPLPLNLVIGAGLYFFLKAVMRIAAIVLYRIMIQRLPKARLEVDGHVLLIPYLSRSLGPISLFTNPESFVEDWRVKFRAMRMSGDVSFDNRDSDYVTGSTQATIALSEETLSFLMEKEHKRCPCDNPIPCWTGDAYHGYFNSRTGGGENWVVEVALLHFDGRKKRRWWDRIELPKLPKFSEPEFMPI